MPVNEASAEARNTCRNTGITASAEAPTSAPCGSVGTSRQPRTARPSLVAIRSTPAAAASVLARGGVDANVLPSEPGATVAVPGVDAHFSADAAIVEDDSAPNVVAVLRGSDPALADTYVVFSAHMDHVGIGTANAAGDSIYNGADDDASGTSALVEMAQAFSMLDQAPRRSLIESTPRQKSAPVRSSLLMKQKRGTP